MYEYMIEVKKPVRSIIIINALINPDIYENRLFLSKFRLTLTKIGKIGKIQGDNTEMTPVKNDIIGIISI